MVALLALLKELVLAAAGGAAGVLRERRAQRIMLPPELPTVVAGGGLWRCPSCGHRCTYCRRALIQTSDPPDTKG